MKRLIWIGLIMLTLAVVAAQCGTTLQSGANTDSNQAAQNAAQAAAEENAVETAQESVVEDTEETVTENTAETVAENVEETVVEDTAETVIEDTEEAVAENPEEAVTEDAEETAEDVAVEESEEAVAETDNVAQQETTEEVTAEQEALAGAGDHPANCDDPFAGVERVRFPHEVWNAERIARFVGSDLVDPDSDLATNFCQHSVDYSEIISGGPPPDGIPPIDNPNFDSIAQGDAWLADVQPVIALAVGDEAKAYPLAILTRHEIANDEIAGIPVAVTFCPLCNAGIVFKREVDDQVLRFGVSGNLRNSDLIMWDNKTLSWWQQFTGEAIVGEMTGTQLEMLPAQMVAWKDFKDAYPNGQVLSNNGRNYGLNPYTGYDSSTQPFLFLGTPDSRLQATERVLGYFAGDTAVAYPLSLIAEKGVIEDTIDDRDVVIFYEPGQVSALDQSVIEASKEVGSAGMFILEVDGQMLTFSYDDGIITDSETGSEWDVFGRAISGELEGAQLEPILSHTHFWFAWAAFRPDTKLYEG